jgi:hypothetical protein
MPCTNLSSPSLALYSTQSCIAGSTGAAVNLAAGPATHVGVVYGASEQLLSFTYFTNSNNKYYGWVLQLPVAGTGWYTYPSLPSLVTGCLDASTGVRGAWSQGNWQYVKFNFSAGVAVVYSDSACATRVVTIANDTLLVNGDSGAQGWGAIRYAANGLAAFSSGVNNPSPYNIGFFYMSLRIQFGSTTSVVGFAENPSRYYNFVLRIVCPSGSFASTDGASCYTCSSPGAGQYVNAVCSSTTDTGLASSPTCSGAAVLTGYAAGSSSTLGAAGTCVLVRVLLRTGLTAAD